MLELQRHWQARRSGPVPAAAVVTAVVLGLMLLGGTLDLLGAAGVVPEF